MNVFDVAFVALAVLAVVGGYRLGFVARVVSLDRPRPRARRRRCGCCRRSSTGSSTTSHGLVLVLTIGLLLVGASLGQALGFVIGGRIRPRRDDGVLGTTDRLARRRRPAWPASSWWSGWCCRSLVASPGWLVRQATHLVGRPADRRHPARRRPTPCRRSRRSSAPTTSPTSSTRSRPTPELGPPPAESGLTRRHRRARWPGRSRRSRARRAAGCRTAPASSWPTTSSSPTPTWWRGRTTPP